MKSMKEYQENFFYWDQLYTVWSLISQNASLGQPPWPPLWTWRHCCSCVCSPLTRRAITAPWRPSGRWCLVEGSCGLCSFHCPRWSHQGAKSRARTGARSGPPCQRTPSKMPARPSGPVKRTWWQPRAGILRKKILHDFHGLPDAVVVHVEVLGHLGHPRHAVGWPSLHLGWEPHQKVLKTLAILSQASWRSSRAQSCTIWWSW